MVRLFLRQQDTNPSLRTEQNIKIFFPCSKFKVLQTLKRGWGRVRLDSDTKGYITIDCKMGFQSCLAMPSRRVSLFTVLLSVWKGLSNNKHPSRVWLGDSGETMTPSDSWPCATPQLPTALPLLRTQATPGCASTAQVLKRPTFPGWP